MVRRHFFWFFCLVFALTGCGDQNTSHTAGKAETGDALAKTASLTIVTSLDNPPFETLDSATHQPKGFDIDLMHLIAKEMGWNIEFRDQEFSSIIPTLNAQKADIAIAGISPTEDRRRVVDFTRPYFKSRNVLLAKATGAIKGVEYVQGKKIGVQLGSTQAEIATALKQRFKDVELKLYNKITEVFEELKNDRVDAAVFEESVGNTFSHLGSGLASFDLSEEFTQDTAIALPKGSPYKEKINAVIERLEKEGVLEQLRRKWFGDTLD